MSDRKKQGTRNGLYGKYQVFKNVFGAPISQMDTRRRIRRGERIENCFVLRYDRDPHAQAALRAYAESCRVDNPELADDLMAALSMQGKR